MPEHYSWLTFALHYIEETLAHNVGLLGDTFIGQKKPTWHDFEPISTSISIAAILIVLGLYVKGRMAKKSAVVPDDRLTLRTFVEVFLDYFYGLAKEVMGPERAKKYFPLIGASACFVFVGNVLALLPGFPIATTSLSVTLGSALVVFILFNLYGIKENGLGYIKHLAGPVWYLAPLVFPIELISLCVRPITLGLRLMLNMSVDHLLLAIFMGFFTVVLPLPVMVLGCVVVVVQTLVFALLTCIYIGLATEHEEH